MIVIILLSLYGELKQLYNGVDRSKLFLISLGLSIAKNEWINSMITSNYETSTSCIFIFDLCILSIEIHICKLQTFLFRGIVFSDLIIIYSRLFNKLHGHIISLW